MAVGHQCRGICIVSLRGTNVAAEARAKISVSDPPKLNLVTRIAATTCRCSAMAIVVTLPFVLNPSLRAYVFAFDMVCGLVCVFSLAVCLVESTRKSSPQTRPQFGLRAVFAGMLAIAICAYWFSPGPAVIERQTESGLLKYERAKTQDIASARLIGLRYRLSGALVLIVGPINSHSDNESVDFLENTVSGFAYAVPLGAIWAIILDVSVVLLVFFMVWLLGFGLRRETVDA